MSNQTFNNLADLDIFSFIKKGAIQSVFNSDIIWLGHGEHVTGEITFLRVNFFKNQCISYTPKYIIKTTISELKEFLATHKIKYQLDIMQNLDNLYFADVEKIKRWITEGKVQKMVAVTTEKYKVPINFSPLTILANLISELQGSLYGNWDSDYGIIGISPEPLYVCEQNKCLTYALAGTISKDETSYQDSLLNDPKEIHEHNLVIDDLTSKLRKISKNINVGNTETIDFGHLAHLKTNIEFDLDINIDSKGLIDNLAPSAALGGFPADVVSTFYSKTNHYQQMSENRIFGGTIGLEYNGYKQALVMIRNLQWDQNQMWIESGSGIVEKSVASKELEEVRKKRDTIKKALFI